VSKDFVARNDSERARLEQLVRRLNDADMAQPLDGGWTVGDALAHLAFYDRRAAILLERFAREGVSASPYDYETLNEALLPLTRRIPPREIAAEVLAAADAADQAAAAVSEELIAAISERNEVRPDRSEHRRSHIDQIEAALGSS
jgi:hypothetical protein